MFTSIVIVIVVIYVFGYAGMIIYDLFLKKEPVEFMPKPKDVDIDISDEAGQFKPNKQVAHTHEGSIGNLCNEQIAQLMQTVVKGFGFERMNQAEKQLLNA